MLSGRRMASAPYLLEWEERAEGQKAMPGGGRLCSGPPIRLCPGLFVRVPPPAPAGRRPAYLLQFAFDKGARRIALVDDVVGNAHASVVGAADGQFVFGAIAVVIDQHQLAGDNGDHDVVILMHMMARFALGRKIPAGHTHALVLDQFRCLGGREAHGFLLFTSVIPRSIISGPTLLEKGRVDTPEGQRQVMPPCASNFTGYRFGEKAASCFRIWISSCRSGGSASSGPMAPARPPWRACATASSCRTRDGCWSTASTPARRRPRCGGASAWSSSFPRLRSSSRSLSRMWPSASSSAGGRQRRRGRRRNACWSAWISWNWRSGRRTA